MIKAVIFDMDGVLVESEEFIRQSEVKTFKKFGIPATLELMAEYQGLRLEEMTAELGKRFGVNLSAKEVRVLQDNNMERYFRKDIPLVPHVKETLESLSSQYKLGLATMRDKNVAKLALQRFKLLSCFNAFTFAQDVKKAKPDPEAYLRTAKLLGIDPKSCVVVEDSEPGFRAGKAAGMIVIARRADHNKNIDFSPADYIVEDLRDIPEIIAP